MAVPAYDWIGAWSPTPPPDPLAAIQAEIARGESFGSIDIRIEHGTWSAAVEVYCPRCGGWRSALDFVRVANGLAILMSAVADDLRHRRAQLAAECLGKEHV